LRYALVEFLTYNLGLPLCRIKEILQFETGTERPIVYNILERLDSSIYEFLRSRHVYPQRQFPQRFIGLFGRCGNHQ